MIWLLLICAVIHLLSTCIQFIATYRTPIVAEVSTEKLPFISVIIAARNEAINLDENIGHILNQNYPEFEVIVVDNDSSDSSGNVLNKWMAQDSRLKAVSYANDPSRKGKKDAISFGINQALGDYLVFTDADCKPHTNQWLLRFGVAFANQYDLVLGSGLFFKRSSWTNALCRMDSMRILALYLTAAAFSKPYMGVARSMGYTKSLFNAVHGFSAHSHIQSGDDDLFIQSLPASVKSIVIPSALTLSEAPKDMVSWFQQKKRHLSTGANYPSATLMYLGTIDISSSVVVIGLFLSPWYFTETLTLVFLGIVLMRLVLLYFLQFRLQRLIGYKSTLSLLFFWDAILSLLNPLFSVASQFSKPPEWISRT